MRNLALTLLFSISLIANSQDIKIGSIWKSQYKQEFKSESDMPVVFEKGLKILVTSYKSDSITFKILHYDNLVKPQLLEQPNEADFAELEKIKGTKTSKIQKRFKADSLKWEISNLQHSDNLKKYNKLKSIEKQLFKLTKVEFQTYFKEQKPLDANSFIKVGILYQPWKIRPSWKNMDTEFSIEPEFNLSASIAYTPTPRTSVLSNFSFVFAPGLTTVEVNELNSDFTKDETLNNGNSSIKLQAFTFGVGIIGTFNNFQVSLLAGADYLPYNNSNYNWVYQNTTWISMGIGVNIFDTLKADKKADSNEIPK